MYTFGELAENCNSRSNLRFIRKENGIELQQSVQYVMKIDGVIKMRRYSMTQIPPQSSHIHNIIELYNSLNRQGCPFDEFSV